MRMFANLCTVFVKKSTLIRNNYKFEGNIKMYLKEIGCEGVDWIHLAQDKDKW
jgi:hypothetical protein